MTGNIIDGKDPIDVQKPLIAIDFDGVITDYDHWRGIDVFHPVQKGAKESIDELVKRGYRILIWTTRGNVDRIADFLNHSGIHYDFINTAPVAPHQNPGKPACFVYIDDNALRHTNWKSTMDRFDRLEGTRRQDFCGWHPDFEHGESE